MSSERMEQNSSSWLTSMKSKNVAMRVQSQQEGVVISGEVSDTSCRNSSTKVEERRNR